MPRSFGWVVLLVAAASVASAAERRVPQVPVSGTALADYFKSVGENIDVHRDQLDLQTLNLGPAGFFGPVFQVYGYTTDTGDTLGVYNDHVLPPTPERYAVLPGDLIAIPLELHAWAGFRKSQAQQVQLVVKLLDVFDQQVGSRTYGAGPPDGNHFGPPDPTQFGFYIERQNGATIYMQDVRNPNGAPKILTYACSSPGCIWLACETGYDTDGDFADFIALVDLNQPAIVPVSRASWGALKQRFH